MLSGMGRDCGGWDPALPGGWDQCDPRTIPPAARRWPSARRAARERAGGAGGDCLCTHEAPHLHDADPSGHIRARAREAGPVTGPAVLHWIMLPLVVGQSQEHAWLATLDVHTRLDGLWLLALGTRDRVGVDLIEAVRPAIVRDSRYIVLAHNHPSGDATPSGADAELTDAVASAAAAQGVVLLDHVVLAPEQFYSFREGALWQIQAR
jgi:DNA repair protein RadC